MKCHCIFSVILALFLFAAHAQADIPPPKPSALEQPAGMGPLPIAIAGIALALAVGAAGFLVARHHSVVRAVALAVAALVLVATAALVYWADQSLAEREALQTQYDSQLKNWRPGGPVRRSPRPDVFGESVAAIAFDPAGGFPSSIPWAALVLSQDRAGQPPELWR